MEQLRQRFVTPRVVITAGAGFGKSSLIDQAIGDNRSRPAGLDLRIDISRRHRVPEALIEAILGSSRLVPTGDVDEDLSRLLGWLTSQSPLDICLIFDDVHELDGSDAIAVLQAVDRDAPANAHLLFAGRHLPAGLVVSGGASIVESDMAFTPVEIEAVAGIHGVDASELASFDGWPALTTMAARTRPSIAVDFALEEVFEQIGPELQRAVTALGIAGRLPETVLGRIVPSVPVDDIVSRVPLVELRDGDVVAHQLWGAVAERAFDAELAEELVEALVDCDSFEVAVEVAQQLGRWDDADSAVLALVAARVHGIPVHVCRSLTRNVPSHEAHRPGHRLLLAIAQSNELAPSQGAEGRALLTELLGLADELAGEGHIAPMQTVLGVAVVFAWISRDPVAIDSVARVVETAGLDDDDWRVSVGLGLRDLVRNRVADAERRLTEANDQPLPPEVRSLVVRVLVTLLGLAGDSEGLQKLDLTSVLTSSDTHVRQTPMVIAWLSGDVDGVVAWRTMRPDEDRHAGDQLTQMVFHAAVRTSFGDTQDLHEFATHPLLTTIDDHPAISRRRALTAAIVHLGLGDETSAGHILAASASDVEAGSLALQELARALCYPYVLVPSLRPLLDTLPHGLHERHRAVARCFLSLRDGQPPAEPLPPPPDIFLAMPLQWSCELARRAIETGVAGGEELAHWLRLRAGARAVEFLAADDDDDDQPETFAPNEDAVRLRFLGPSRIERSTPDSASTEWRRLRVRQLLAIMVLRRRIDRKELAGWLWPDKTPNRAAANLRVTLTYARRVVGDHDAPRSQQILVDRGGRLELVPHRRLSVDLWEHQAAFTAARLAEDRGDISAAIDALEQVLALWSGTPLVDLEYDDRAAPARQNLRSEFCRAGTRCGELLLARREDARALAAAQSVLDQDPAWEPAHRLAIALAVHTGDDAVVSRALDRCRRALAEVGVEPDANTLIAENLAAVDGGVEPRPEHDHLLFPSRIAALLGNRWKHRLVEIVAPSDAGKSVAVERALAERSGDTMMVDVRLFHQTTDPKTAALAATTQLGAVVTDAQPGDQLIAAVQARAPIEVCLVVDDVDRLADQPAALELLRTLLRDLPANGHVLVAGRRPADLHTARLELKGEILRIDADDLALDIDLTAGLPVAHRHLVDATWGWAGVIGAISAGGRDAAIESIRAITAALTEDDATSIALAARLGEVNVDQLAWCGLEVDTDEIAATVPFVRIADVRINARSSTWELLEQEILDPPTIARANTIAAGLEERAGRPTRALAILLEAGTPDMAVGLLVERLHIAAADPTSPDWDQVQRFLDLEGPPTAVAIGDAIVAHHDGRDTDANDALERAMQRGVDQHAAHVNRLHLAWCEGGVAGRRTIALAAAGGRSDIASMARAAIAAADGDHLGALALLDDIVDIDPVSRVQADLQRAVSAAFTTEGGANAQGDHDRFVSGSQSAAQWLRASAGWVRGDVSTMAAMLGDVGHDVLKVPAGCRAFVARAAASLAPGRSTPQESFPPPWAPLVHLAEVLDLRNATIVNHIANDSIEPLGSFTDPSLLIPALPIETTVSVAGAFVASDPAGAIVLLDRLEQLHPDGYAAAIATPLESSAAAAVHAHNRSRHVPVVIEFLGNPPRLLQGGNLITVGHWRRSRVRQLAALLATGTWSRERLAVELWPDASAIAGARNLRVTLYYLREALDPGRPPDTTSLLIAADADHLLLAKLPGVDTDAWSIVEALDVFDAHAAAGRHGEASDAARLAASFWQNPPGELTDLDPVNRHLEVLRERIVDALCSAGDTLAALGDISGTLATGERVVGLEPLRQHGYRLMIAACLAAGRTVQARSILETCRTALTEAGVAMSRETEILASVLERTSGHPTHEGGDS